MLQPTSRTSDAREGNHGLQATHHFDRRRRRSRDGRNVTPIVCRVGAERALSGSGRAGSRSELRQVPPPAGGRRTARGRHALVRGAGVVRRRPLPAVERHPQQPHHEMGGGDRRCQRFSQAVQSCEREYPRPPGPARHCEHLTRRITRTEYDGTVTVLMDKFDGKPLNSPNDIVVKSDDTIWFTDPPFGILGNYEGQVSTPELPTNVYRLDPKTGRATVASGDINRPNGLAFSPDESKLYVVESNLPRKIHVFDV